MKILLIRFSSIGDIVICSPIIRCIKQQIPDAELHFLCKTSFASLSQYNPYIDRLHSWDDERSKKVMQQLKSEQYDLIIDLHKNIRSKRIVRALGVSSLSFDKLNIAKWLLVNFKLNRLPKRHLVDRYFDSLRSLNISNDNKGLEFYLDPNINRRGLFEKIGLGEDWKSFNVIAIGGTYYTKRMPPSKIASIIKDLRLPSIIIGGPSDLESEAQILAETAEANCIGSSGKLSLQESAFLIAQAHHVYTHDSGSMHIAAAFRKPMSVVWGNTHPAFGMYPYGYGQDDHLFQYQIDLPCRPCSKLGYEKCPKSHFNCMEMQNIGEIVKNWESKEQAQ